MAIFFVARAELFPGREIVVDGPAPDGRRAAFFEDDGESGYFYAVEPQDPNDPIQDAVLVYAVEQVRDRHLASTLQIGWSADMSKVALLINGLIHAAFDFSSKRGYCKAGFPPPASSSDWLRLEWTKSEEALFD